MGYWASDGSYVYDENDIVKNTDQKLKTTGDPSFDERVDFTERQKSMNSFGESIKTTGGPGFDERVDFAEKQKSMNHFGETIKTTGGPGFDERMNDSMAQVQYARERDKEKFATLNALMNNLPSNSEDLRLAFAAMDHRLDLMKKLVEHYKDQFLNVAVQYKGNYSPEASEIINNKLTQYLCLIETLKSDGYTFGSELNSYVNNSTYDPYKPDVELEEIMSIMHIRRKNDADVEIIFPVDYDFTDYEFQNKGDAVTIINTVNEHLKNNEYMAAMWKKAGYIDEEQENKRGL